MGRGGPILPLVGAINTIETYEDVAQKRRALFIYVLSSLSLAGLLTYGGIVLFLNHRYSELIHISILAAFYVTIILLVRSGRLNLGSILISLIGAGGYFIVLYTDPDGTSGLFLLNTFPVFVFFLLGKQRGLEWTLGFMCLLVVAYLLNLTGIYPMPPYRLDAIREFFVTLIITSVMIYRYQDLIEATQRIILQRDEELAKERDSLDIKVDQRTHELQEARARLLASINSLERGYITTDKSGQIILANQEALKIVNHLRQGQPALTNLDLDSLHTTFQSVIDFKKQIEQTVHQRQSQALTDLNIADKVFEIDLSPVTFNEEVSGAVVLIQDVTEAKVLERAKDEFLTIASHELRTPLSIIRGNTALIQSEHQEELKHNPKLSDKIFTIYNACTHLIKMVNDFLNLSRLEQGQIQFSKDPIDVVPILEAVQEEMLIIAKQKNLSIEIAAPAELPKLPTDSEKLKEILLNLVGNAVKFTEKGEIVMRVKQETGQMLIEVSDTGMGIPAKNQPLLFRKFQQAEDNIYTRDIHGGVGLGLYISRRLAEGMGGQLELVHSEINQGSTFALKLPL